MLAHVTTTGGGGGGSGALRFILLLAGLGVLAVAARLRSQDRPVWMPAVVGVVGVALVASGFAWPQQKEPKIYLTVVTPDPEAVVPANQPVPIEVRVEGARVAANETDKGGHLHLSLDGQLQSMPYGTKAELPVPPGRHTITVEFSDEEHRSYDPPIAVDVEVIAQ